MEQDAGETLTKEMDALRVYGRGEKYLARCDGYKDEVTASHLYGDPREVELRVRSVGVNSGLVGFEKRFLISRLGNEHLVTMTGYVFEGEVGIPIEGIDIANVYVNGKPIHSDLDIPEDRHIERMEAVHTLRFRARHQKRLRARYKIRPGWLFPDSLSLDEAMEVYGRIVKGVQAYAGR
jgi:hypothetical protein